MSETKRKPPRHPQHDNSLLARAMRNPALMARYKEWRREYMADTGSILRWGSQGGSTGGNESVGQYDVREEGTG